MKITNNFADHEFRCPCCEMLSNSDAFIPFVERLQKARDKARIPFVITSGYRCPRHNAEIGGVPDSSHMKGIAADIRIRSNRERFLILNGLMYAGFRRIGVKHTYIHVDMDPDKSQFVTWLD